MMTNDVISNNICLFDMDYSAVVLDLLDLLLVFVLYSFLCVIQCIRHTTIR